MIKKLLFAACLVAMGATVFSQGTLIWEENFDGGTSLSAIGWSQASNATDGGWRIGTTSFLSSTYFPIPARPGNIIGTNDDACNCNKSNERLISPTFDFSTAPSEIRLLFDVYFIRGTYQGVTESLQLFGSTDDGATWTLIETFTGAGGWRSPYLVDISAYSGQSTVKFSFLYNDGGQWEWGAMLDNVRIVEPDNVIKAKLNTVAAGKYVDAVPRVYTGYSKLLVGDEVSIAGTVSNAGFPTITSYDVTLTRGLETYTETISNQNINLGSTGSFSFSIPVNMGANDFEVTISKINGTDDDDMADNSGTASIEGVEAQPNRKVVVEEGTGTWCTWCPRGAVAMDYIADKYPDVAIPIAVHNSTSDPMRVAAYDIGISGLIGGYPGGLVEREDDIDPLLGSPNFEAALIEHLTWPAQIIVTQNVDLNPTLRKVDVTSSLQFLEEMNGDFRIAVVFTEEGVSGTASGYAQVNAYSGGGNGPMGGFENLPSPVPASQMVYNHVARALVGGFTGKAGSVPANNPAGSVMSYTSSYIVPSAYNIDNMHAVTMVIDNATGRIINSEVTPIPFVSTAAPTLAVDEIKVSIAPNPVQEMATVTLQVEETTDVQIRLIDAFGRVVSEQNHANISGKQFLPLQAGNLANGMYTLVATANGKMVSKPFVVQH